MPGSSRASSSGAEVLGLPPEEEKARATSSECPELQPRDGVQDPSLFFKPVADCLQRELAKLLTGDAQPGLVSPVCGEQAQWYHPASLSSESGESLRHVGC